MKENNTLKYRRKDIIGGYIYDKDEIEYYKVIQKNDVLENKLLGEFNNVGSYVINTAILKELVEIKKIYTDAQNKKIFCSSIKSFEGRKLNFVLDILPDSPKKGQVTATLEILEEIERVNGYYKNINSIPVESFVTQNDKFANHKIFGHFHIVSLSVGVQKEEDEKDYFKIQDRYDEIKKQASIYLPLDRRAQKALFDERYKLLYKSKDCQSILEEFNKYVFHINNIFLHKNDPNYYRHLNQILDDVIDSNRAILRNDKHIMKQLYKTQNEYIAMSESIIKLNQAEKNAQEMVVKKKEEAKEQAKEETKQPEKEVKEQVKEVNEEKKEEVKAEVVLEKPNKKVVEVKTQNNKPTKKPKEEKQTEEKPKQEEPKQKTQAEEEDYAELEEIDTEKLTKAKMAVEEKEIESEVFEVEKEM